MVERKPNNQLKQPRCIRQPRRCEATSWPVVLGAVPTVMKIHTSAK
jgi:hypothetical protein